jgi:hypothetical protein
MPDSTLFGAPEEIRTPDPQIRSLLLLPFATVLFVTQNINGCSRLANDVRR